MPLRLQPGVAINGRVVFEGAQPTADELQTLSFRLVALGSGGRALYTGGGRVDAGGRFRSVPPDTYQFTTTRGASGAAEKWTIASSTADGRDAFEAPLRVNPNGPMKGPSRSPVVQVADASRPAAVLRARVFP